jgi:hypothetical protein
MRLLTIFACMLMLAACDSDVSTPQPDQLDSVAHTRKISLELGGTLYDFDSLRAGNYAYLAHGSPTDSMYVMLMRKSSEIQPGDISFSLYLSWPKPFSGNFNWENLTAKSTGFGCIITIDSINTHYRRVYKSVSGSTRVDCFFRRPFFDTDPAFGYTDSVFGTFNGSVKDSLGNVVEIRNGRFYWGDLR